MVELLPFLILGVLMYALLIFPQQRRNRAHQQLLSSLSEGDEVLTNAGIYGFVKEVEPDVLWVEVAENVELRIAKSSVASKITATSADQSAETSKDS